MITTTTHDTALITQTQVIHNIQYSTHQTTKNANPPQHRSKTVAHHTYTRQAYTTLKILTASMNIYLSLSFFLFSLFLFILACSTSHLHSCLHALTFSLKKFACKQNTL